MKPETYYKNGKNAEGKEETPHIVGKVYFIAFCAVCHEHLCKRIEIAKSPRQRQNVLFIEPCPNCLDAARRGIPVEIHKD